MKENGLTESINTNNYKSSTTETIDGFSIREILSVIWRRKFIVINTVVVFTLLTVLILQWVTPLYTSKALIMLKNREQNVANLDSAINSLSINTETITSEIEVISSRSLLKNIIEELNLKLDPDFKIVFSRSEKQQRIKTLATVLTEEQKQEKINSVTIQKIQQQRKTSATLLTKIYADVIEFFSRFKIENKVEFKSFGDYSENDFKQQLERSTLVEYFLDNLDVKQVSQSYVISVEFSAIHPIMASQIVNKLIDLYIKQQLNEKFEATHRASSWLNQKVIDLQKTVEKSETAVESFRRFTGLLQGRDGNLTEQQISQINGQLMLAKASLTEARARLSQLTRQSDSRIAIESTREILESVLIQGLRTQESDLQRSVAELSTEYGKLHPKMINLSASLTDLQNKILVEEEKILKGLESEVIISNAKVESLQNSLNKLKEQVAESNEDAIKLKALERESEANRLLLNNFLSKYKEVSSQEDANIHPSDAVIISRANIPIAPSFPKKIPIILLSVVASSLIGFMLVLLSENLKVGFFSGEQIESITGIASLGFIPLTIDVAKPKKVSASYLVQHPKSAFSQAFNTLCWNIQLRNKQKPAKTILITSTQPQEGKTTIATNLAQKYALAGKKTIVIDTDCYKPSVHNAFNQKATSGLIDVLLYEQAFRDVVQKDKMTGVHILHKGKADPNPTNILASDRFDRLLRALSDRYDIIILDSSPIMVAPDAILLAQKVDTTLFVVRWAMTSQKAVNLSLNKILKTDSHINGVLLSMVDVTKYSHYDFGDSGTYTGQLKSYYEG